MSDNGQARQATRNASESAVRKKRFCCGTGLCETVLLTIAGALVFALALLLTWERRALEDAVVAWGRQMPIVAVLRDEVGESRANALAAELARKVPALECTVVGRREARSLLALQEPWLARLPEVAVGELPIVLEIRHPALFRAPRQVEAFVSSLQAMREVDFVIFNSHGHDRVILALAAVRRHVNGLLGAALAVAGMLFIFLHFQVRRLRRHADVARALATGVGMGLSAVGLGWLLVLAYVATVLGGVPSSPLPSPAHVGLVAVGLVALFVLLELLHVQPGAEGRS